MNLSESDKFNKLAESLKNGDQNATEEIFSHFSPLIYRFFIARTQNKAVSEDLTQDVFMKLVSKIDTFDGKLGSFSPWLWQIARNLLIDFYREKKEMNFSDAPSGFENNFSSKENSERKILAMEIMDLVKELSEEEQEIFSLFYVSDLSYKEIGKITGKKSGSLRVTIHRLNKKVRDRID